MKLLVSFICKKYKRYFFHITRTRCECKQAPYSIYDSIAALVFFLIAYLHYMSEL